jgi:hypothetical protein
VCQPTQQRGAPGYENSAQALLAARLQTVDGNDHALVPTPSCHDCQNDLLVSVHMDYVRLLFVNVRSNFPEETPERLSTFGDNGKRIGLGTEGRSELALVEQNRLDLDPWISSESLGEHCQDALRTAPTIAGSEMKDAQSGRGGHLAPVRR